MYSHNLFITGDIESDARDEVWIQMKFYKKQSFWAGRYAQNVILFLTYHHYRSSQCPFDLLCR